MTTSVRFCLSYGPLQWDFIAFKVNMISIRKRIVDMDVVNDVTCTRQRGPGRVAQSVGHLTRKSEVLGSIPGLATYFRFSFR